MLVDAEGMRRRRPGLNGRKPIRRLPLPVERHGVGSRGGAKSIDGESYRLRESEVDATTRRSVRKTKKGRPTDA